MMRQPGHWLLLIPTLRTSVILAYIIVLTSLIDDPFDRATKSIYFGFAIIEFAVSAMYVLASFKKVGGAWRILFLTQAFAIVASSFFYALIGFELSVWGTDRIFFVLSNWGSGITAVAALGLGLVDRFVGKRRDWLHWTGVLAFIATTFVLLLRLVLTET
jgi:hypothetical protein